MIKNFIYLDEEKMYSLSSQLFEGITEYVLNELSSDKEKSETQKGPIGSGKILGDILRNKERSTEKKFLNDYSYTIFEKKILEERSVAIISDATTVSELTPLESSAFIKITSRVIFNDANSINKTLKNFNKIGKAITHVSNFKELSTAKLQLENEINGTNDRNKKAKLQSQSNRSVSIGKLAKATGLQLDQEFIDDLALILDYGFQDQLEVQMSNGATIFSANLNRSFLRESEDLVIRKYSRKTEINFTLFGIITQHQKNKTEDFEQKEDFDNFKEALANMISHLSNVEATFTGRLSNEIIIDPIALYTEI